LLGSTKDFGGYCADWQPLHDWVETRNFQRREFSMLRCSRTYSGSIEERSKTVLAVRKEGVGSIIAIGAVGAIGAVVSRWV